MKGYNGDTFYTHECVLCKKDQDASYCIPKPSLEMNSQQRRTLLENFRGHNKLPRRAVEDLFAKVDQLEAEFERLRAVLEEIAKEQMDWGNGCMLPTSEAKLARAALASIRGTEGK